ncbi:hypothetical protein ACFVT1_40065 [Streptomyces sp. NPDC057963]|uniref:hypothetical protein n=1 Tax=Streptomyces sp. NPDC057963 TaxID=3346290 RepID=UPI0036F16E35
MTQLERSTSTAQATVARTALNWLIALTLLVTVMAVTVLAATGNSQYLAPVIAIGSGALAVDGSVHIRIHIRR